MQRVSSGIVIALLCGLVGISTGCGSWVTEDDLICWFFGGAGDPCQDHFWAPDFKAGSAAAVSAGDVLFISASAHAGGAMGTNWRTDIAVHNLGPEVAAFRVLALLHDTDNSVHDEVELSLAAGHSIRLDDVLATEFSIDGTAALVLAPSSGKIVATSRTYNLLAAGNPLGLPAGSTFGQFIPAQPLGEAVGEGQEGRIVQLSHTQGEGIGSRTNLGLVNVTSSDLDIVADLFTADGIDLGSVRVTLPPAGYRQINRVFERVTGDDVEDGYAIVHTTTSRGRFFAYASVVDNLTGDPVAVPATVVPTTPPQGVADPIYIVASAHAAGAAGTNWRTDLEIHCWSDASAEFSIELLKHGIDNSTPQSRTHTLEAGTSLRLSDILDTEFGFTGGAALRVTPVRGQIIVTSRTFNLIGEPNDLGLPAGATFGQFIPGLTAADAIGPEERGLLIQLANNPAGDDGSRTNLVLVNTANADTEVSIALHRADGTLLGTTSRVLAPYEYRQLNRVFELATPAVVDHGYIVVTTTSDDGAVFALASVVDNLTGDPIGIAAPTILPTGVGSVVDDVAGTHELIGLWGLETVFDGLQEAGVDGIQQTLVDYRPDLTSPISGGVIVDYSDGTTLGDGRTRSGSFTVDLSGLSVDSSSITGTVSVIHDDLQVDGAAPPIGSSQWTLDFTERPNGTVYGEATVAPIAKTTASASLQGTIGIDTAICPDYPISGQVSAIVDGNEVTITFGPFCTSRVDHEVRADTGGGGGGGGGGGDLLAVEWSFTGASSAVGTIDSTTGEWLPLGSSGFPRLNSLACSPSGACYSVTETGTGGSKRLITIDPSTGAGSEVAPITEIPTSDYISSLAFSPDGTLFAVVAQNISNTLPSSELYTLNSSSGVATFIGPVSGFDGVNTIDFDDDSGTLYGWDSDAGLITINRSSGAGTDVNPSVSGPSILALAVLPGGDMVGGQHNLYAIDPSTGEAEQIGSAGLNNVRGVDTLPAKGWP